jgi:hypothetical protein
MLFRCSPWEQISLGSVPPMKTSVRYSAHPALRLGRLPVSGSMGTVMIPGGTAKLSSATPESARRMNSIQMGRAARPPVSSLPRLRGTSWPTQTPTARRGV